MKKRKQYNPTSKFNPAYQKIQIEKLGIKIENHRRDLEAISRSHEIHISYLGNFARHDIKNAIQSMDSIFSTTQAEEFTDETIASLQTHLQVIRSTIDNFSKLVPYSHSGKFTTSTLMLAIELLTRADIQKEDITIKLDYPKTSDVEIQLPFHGILQMLHNTIINSIKSLENRDTKALFIKADFMDNMVVFQISDTGTPIPDENVKKVFEYGFSTTGGSGIGLFHAKYLCDQFKGKISLENNPGELYTKTFIITLPIIPIDHAEDSFNN